MNKYAYYSGYILKIPNISKDVEQEEFTDSAAAAAKSLQLCLTVYDPIDGSPPDSSVPGILQTVLVGVNICIILENWHYLLTLNKCII